MGLSLSIKSVFTPKQQSRGSAHSKAFAAQTHENRGRVPRFSYFKREKVSAWELSDVRVLRSQNTDCRKNDSFSTVSGHPFSRMTFLFYCLFHVTWETVVPALTCSAIVTGSSLSPRRSASMTALPEASSVTAAPSTSASATPPRSLLSTASS